MRYVIYRDHVGWVIATVDDHELLCRIYRAMTANSWGAFMDALPASERSRLLEEHGDVFGADFNPDMDPAEPEDAETLILKTSPFDPSQLPGFDEGDYPFWPADDAQISDPTCRQAYPRFGVRQSGFIHTFHHLREDELPNVEAWLRSLGHTLETVEDPRPSP